MGPLSGTYLRTATVATVGLGAYFFRTKSQSDDHGTSLPTTDPSVPARWLHWLVNTNDYRYGINNGLRGSDIDEGLKGLSPSPGTALAWGGVFGRSPILLEELGNRVVRVVAAANGLGAAIDADGHAVVFAYDALGRTSVQRIELSAPAATVAWLESRNEAVFVDTGGAVHVTTLQHANVNQKRNDMQHVPDTSVETDDSASSNQQSTGVMSNVSAGPVRRVDLICRNGPRRTRAVDVSCGTGHCVAVAASGAAFSWGGNNSHGQLGSISPTVSRANDLGVRDTAIEMELADGSSGVVAVACGDAHTLLLAANGQLFATGADGWMQLGREAQPWLIEKSKRQSLLPREAILFGDLVGRSVAAGANHSAFLVRDGTLYTCGFNQYGQLGHHNYATFAPPSPVADVALRAIEVIAAGNHTCVVSDNGILRCVGANESGQLGTGSLQPSATWRKVRFRKKSLKPSYVHATSRATSVVVPAEKCHWQLDSDKFS